MSNLLALLHPEENASKHIVLLKEEEEVYCVMTNGIDKIIFEAL